MKGGLAAYARINQLALGLVRDGGVLVSSSCSQHLAMEDLRAAVARATAKAGAHARLLFAGGQGPDHPVHCASARRTDMQTSIRRLSDLRRLLV